MADHLSQNAFSRIASVDPDFNLFSIFVPDVLHEFELGVWKAAFIHLLRILCAEGGNAIQKLNERYVLQSLSLCFMQCLCYLNDSRYRHVPTFSNKIRRFSNNASGMKRLAARNFEDLLQVCRNLNITLKLRTLH